jgi:hypothetical protein
MTMLLTLSEGVSTMDQASVLWEAAAQFPWGKTRFDTAISDSKSKFNG